MSSEGSSEPRRPGSSRREVDELVETIRNETRERSGGQRAGKGSGKRGIRPRLLYVLLVLAVVGNAYFWIGQPAWLTGDGSGVSTVEEAEGLLRFRMYVQAQRIHAFQREHGTPPVRLEETGTPFDGIRYERTGPDSWRLVGELRGAQLLLTSDMAIRDFLQGRGDG